MNLVASTNTGFTFTGNVHYSATTNYSANTSTYSVTLPSISGNNQTFIYRITNEKHFTNLKNQVISATTFSRIVQTDTNDAIINKY